jgi:hypothetical protein
MARAAPGLAMHTTLFVCISNHQKATLGAGGFFIYRLFTHLILAAVWTWLFEL